MKRFLNSHSRISVIALVTVLTVSFHYGLFLEPGHGSHDLFHAIHGRLCYIPIILGAIWFGVRGGLVTSLAIILLTLPYGFIRGLTEKSDIVGEYTEMVFYLGIGLTAGILIELQRRERKRSEALSRELARQKRLSSLGEMAAGLAHEIKNPLGSIRGSAELLSDDFPEGSKKHELLKVLTAETGRLNRVVDDFLSFARPQPLKRRPCQLNRILENVVAQVNVEPQARRISIVTDFDHDLPEGHFDPEKLHQVFLNVSLNAIAAMPDGGTLRIETRRRMVDGEPHVYAAFEDSGSGIDPEGIDKVFDPFFTTKEKGTGLGLSISLMIVHVHGGHMVVERSSPKGTRVSATLPLSEE